MSFELNNIYNKDCVIGMKELKESSIDLIIADPPYQISKASQFGTLKDRKNPRTGTYFGEWDDNFDNQKWIKESFRVLKKGGSLLVFNDLKKISLIIDIAISVGYVYKDTIIWNKSNPMPRNRDRRYVQDIEMVLLFVKPGKPWTFNRYEDNYESCVKRFPSESGGGYKRIHPTQKPVKFIENLMKIHSNEGDLVLDPFMGSGTTAVSALNLSRNYIGFELDMKYYKESKRRVDEYARRVTHFLNLIDEMKKVIIFIIGFVLALGLDSLVGYFTQSYEWAGAPNVLYIIFSVAYWTGSNE